MTITRTENTNTNENNNTDSNRTEIKGRNRANVSCMLMRGAVEAQTSRIENRRFFRRHPKQKTNFPARISTRIKVHALLVIISSS